MLLCQVRLCSQWFSETLNTSLLKKIEEKAESIYHFAGLI